MGSEGKARTWPRATTDSIALRGTDEYGEAAFATRALARGELVLSERPLIVAKEPPSALAQASVAALPPQAEREGPSDMGRLCAFVAASADVQRRVLAMWCPPDYTTLQDAVIQDARKMAELFRAKHKQGKEHSLDTLHRVLGVFDMNCHEIDAGMGLFELGAKLAHSCEPNTVFHSVEDRLEFRALRDVREGEMLTASYLGQMDWTSTRVRRLTLEGTKRFVCRCPRCSRPDPLRAMPCPVCNDGCRGARGELTAEFATGARAAALAHADPAREDAGLHDIWACEKCGGTFREDQMGIVRKEAEMEMVASEVARGAATMQPEESERALKMLYREYLTVLGPDHWATVRVLATELEARADRVCRAPAAPPEAEAARLRAGLKRDYGRVCGWLAARAGLRAREYLGPLMSSLATALWKLGDAETASAIFAELLDQLEAEYGKGSTEAKNVRHNLRLVSAGPPKP